MRVIIGKTCEDLLGLVVLSLASPVPKGEGPGAPTGVLTVIGTGATRPHSQFVTSLFELSIEMAG
jgi:hypothetical protein